MFSAALVQRRGFFEVEYVLSLDVGGGGPRGATTPVIVQCVKKMFRVAAEGMFDDRTERVEEEEEWEILVTQ